MGGSVTWGLLGLQGQKWLWVEGGREQIAEGEVGWGHSAEKGTRSLRSSAEGQWRQLGVRGDTWFNLFITDLAEG